MFSILWLKKHGMKLKSQLCPAKSVFLQSWFGLSCNVFNPCWGHVDLVLYLYQQNHLEDTITELGNSFICILHPQHLCICRKRICTVISTAVCTLSGRFRCFYSTVFCCCVDVGTAWWLLCSGEASNACTDLCCTSPARTLESLGDSYDLWSMNLEPGRLLNAAYSDLDTHYFKIQRFFNHSVLGCERSGTIQAGLGWIGLPRIL